MEVLRANAPVAECADFLRGLTAIATGGGRRRSEKWPPMHWLDLLLPRICRLCDAPVQADLELCPPCRRSLPWNHRACRQCGLPLLAEAGRCARCAAKPPPFQGAIAPLLFAGPVPQLIHAIKFGRGYGEAKLLSRLLGDAVAASGEPLPDLLAPVPLATGRLLRRGHNQAVLLAAPLARRFGIPLCRTGVRRVGRAKPQRGQSRAARSASVRGAFQVRRPCSGLVAIVDDVMTTGATASELTGTLLAAGADAVVVWAAARAA